ncbi:hypothetical protein ACP70R_033954 [Stipagrostis hirtigluma subsp. patula]
MGAAALFEPPAKSYVIDVKPGVKCIGVQKGEWHGVSVFGNILQQEHLWEFDLKKQMVGFKASSRRAAPNNGDAVMATSTCQSRCNVANFFCDAKL